VTLRRRVAGTQATRRDANRDRQIFDYREEEAIAEHCLMMADRGFPLTFDFLHRIAQAIINDRTSSNNEYDIGRHWVRGFLDRYPTLDQRYIAYQERVRKSAVRKDIRQLFYRDLANLAC